MFTLHKEAVILDLNHYSSSGQKHSDSINLNLINYKTVKKK